LLKDRVTFEWELLTSAQFYFETPNAYDHEMVAKKWTSEAVEVLQAFADAISSIQSATEEELKLKLVNILERQDVKMGKVMPALRLAITGGPTGPDLMGMIKILGGTQASQRILKAIDTLASRVIE